MKILRLALASVFILPWVAPGQVAILQIQVVEGEGAVHPPGSRSVRALTVEVTDETGKPVEHASVSFHLPDDGPGGVFLSGLRTEVAVTDALGRASIHGLQWNHTPGRFQIRIVASREQARAGIVSFHYIGDASARARPVPVSPSAPATPPAPSTPAASRGHSKWIVLATLLAAGAAAAVVNGSRSKSTPQVAAAAMPAPVAAPAATLSIGNPTITVGKP
ncbi:conserved exported hypothetical protein [Candidatus Sulfopaludibacter sp. SbA3]|nr:conserved exported hypothetical protein [Candidatus Sulfopaludibacter sp. SbA3]